MRSVELGAPEWQCAACKMRSFLSRDTCRGCNKQRDEKHDEYINEWSQTAAWPQQGGGSSRDAAHPVNKPKGAAQAPGTGKSIGDARRMYPHLRKQGAAMKQAQPLGQKVDQARARFRRAGASAAEGSPVASNASSTSQREPGQNLGSFDRNYRKHVEPRRRATTDHLINVIRVSKAILLTSSVILSQEGGAALVAEQDAGPELWNLDEGETEQMADLVEVHAPGGPPVETTRARKAAAERTPMTPPPKKTRTVAPVAVEQGGAQSSQALRLSARAMAESQRDRDLATLSQRACALVPALASS